MHEVYDVEIPGIVWAIALAVVVSVLIFNYSKSAAAHRLEILKLQKLAADEIARAEQEEQEHFLSMRLRATRPVIQNLSSPSLIANHSSIASLSIEPLQVAQSGLVKEASTVSLLTQKPNTTLESTSIIPAHRPAPDSYTLASRGLCAVCSTPTKKQCSRCKSVKYCSRDCQSSHWSHTHKWECVPKKKISTHAVQLDSVQSSPKSNSHSTEDDSSSDQGDSQEEVKEERSSGSFVKPPRIVEPCAVDGRLPNPSKILFPYEDFVKLYCDSHLRLVPCGLINCGNSCFANVVLQCLTFTRPLAAYLLKDCHKEECRRNNWCFMCELQNHIHKVRGSQSPFSPLQIVSQIRNIGDHMGYGRQEDAHEFMRVAIDSMQSICLDNVGGERSVDQRTQETTLIQHIFGGHLQSQVRCMECHHESYKYENMMDLTVEIHGNVETLEDALGQFTTTEWLDGENKYKCDSCNAYVKAWKRLVIHEAPNILTIALKRFQSGKYGKLNKRVSFPEILDMSSYMSAEGDEPPIYELYGVVVHIDMFNASFFGHYICYIKDFQGLWYEVDDKKVKEVEPDKALQQRAYMLLYSRTSVRQAPTVEQKGMQISGGAMTSSNHSEKAPLPNGKHVWQRRTITLESTDGYTGAITANNGNILDTEPGYFRHIEGI
ncbi:hypothetical protein KP509_15G035800 [Ceratopteris richardii]|uniref:Uncharacterized protein n=1 Tax=Ceratopteris richardii TaxID=49495 RepID=A0A8T2T447_CERRI|nr:hypothetical protein KP509_15G035800 [Ceratopteris richardii]